ncbi:MAG: hypothetical protein FWG55_00945 [Candidatus Bathyarchaeota archaeon]|jgi:mRNA-degrading endonuclease RelE of RelBE toxin-antitoxin system|nr:hypothetical protein [Candidatus Termiticorpusculum sp.]MDR2707677.1 hypothetical protein [Nitrososphaerota archaeon]
MSKSSPTYKAIYTQTFGKQLRKIGDALRVKRIKETAEKIIENPYHQVEFSKGKYRGKREYYAWRGDRLIFTVCEQCRQLNHLPFNNCQNCQETPSNQIIFWEIIESHKY